MSDYMSSGNLVTDTREIAVSQEWESQSDWEAYQERNNIEIVNGTLQLEAVEVPTENLEHHYQVEDFTTSLWEDSVSNNDIDVSGLSKDENEFGGFGGIQSDGSTDYGVSGQPIDPFEPWALAFSFNTTDTGIFGYRDRVNDDNDWRRFYFSTAGFSDATEGHLAFEFTATHSSVSSDGLLVETDSVVNDGTDYKVIIQNTASDPNADDIQIYLDTSDNEVSTNIYNNTQSGTVFTTDDFGYFAQFNERENTIDWHWEITMSDILWYSDYLDSNQRDSIMSYLP